MPPPPNAEGLDLLTPGLVHEMRHPLLGIKAGLQFLERRLGESLSGLEEWSLVKGQLGRLEELFRNYEEFLHPEMVQPAPFEVHEAMGRALMLLRFQLRKLGPRFTVEGDEPGRRARGTPTALVHALTNVLANALDALAEAGGTGRLALRTLTLADGALEVRVSDEGPGIPPDLAESIFEPRFTTKPPGKGSGLGLSVARHMLASAGGSICLVQPGDPLRLAWARTEFAIHLPSADAPPEEAVAEAVPAQGPLRVLVVDDEEVLLQVYQQLLEEEGMQVATAPSGEGALAQLGTARFDLLLTDKNMPGMDGLELAGRARQLAPHMAVVMVTAYGSADSAQRLRELGAEDYLTKPFDLEALGLRLRAAVARRRQRLAAAASSGPAGSEPRGPVAVVLREEAQRRAVGAALEALQRAVVQAPGVEEALAAGPHALVVGAGSLTPPALLALWRAQAAGRRLQLVVQREGASEREAAAVLSAGACAELPRAALPETLQVALALALGPQVPR
ncbi:MULTISPECIES: response regulator [Myxococcaceae]|uniref:response regulator n=1 Tax=Myxococcaceae TaxID=31 RepID=UPI00188E5C6F|nr:MULTISPECIES: response regulator [Myxococcaceae]MBF5042030.1 response regulator [Simulacricoccus sp. 17bor-14]